MRLRNKKTGEVVDVESLGHAESLKEKYGYQVTLSWATEYENLSCCKDYNSLAELNEDWEDAPEEPRGFWFIDDEGGVQVEGEECEDNLDGMKGIGNYFETKEEAEKAVKKLKAWKRLKDKGFRFDGVEAFSEGLLEIDAVLPTLEKAAGAERLKIGVLDDLWLLFRGEE